MRVALVHPSYWPEVTRGSERVIHDLGSTLAARGHDVTLLTSHRASPSTATEDGMRVVRSWRPPRPPMLTRHELHVENAPNVFLQLLRGDFDVAHAHFPVDAWAAAMARRRGGPPVIMTMHGLPTREYLVARRHRLDMLRAVVSRAAECTVVSAAAARPFRRYLLREPVVVGNGIHYDDFAVEASKAPVPTLLCTASLGDPRKRGELLFRAFSILRVQIPDARLLVVRGRDPVMSGAEPEVPEGAEWLEPDHRPEVLGRRYAEAWATVLPAVYEAFGLVLTESLAAGTPVVADRSGAGPEIVNGDAIGRLFEADDAADLARAMRETLELRSHAGTVSACRARAAGYDWSHVVERYETLYEAVAAGGVRANQKW